MMTYEQFMESMAGDTPPDRLPPLLEALWHDGKNNWEHAHNIAQEVHDRNGSWIHAYLHRKEGDHFNARYWYGKAGKPEPAGTLKEEWEALVRNFL